MNDRFKWIPKWHNPVFFPERLEEPFKHKKPACIFVGSMCDLFGEWVCGDWIKQVLMVCEQNPKHTFLFLTKNPRRYMQFDFPKNSWLGVTLTTEKDYDRHLHSIELMNDHAEKTFVSIEPILGSFKGIYPHVDLIIYGAMTGRNVIKPQREWIETYHPNIYYKSNIRKLFPELKNE
jgi:protein gp37